MSSLLLLLLLWFCPSSLSLFLLRTLILCPATIDNGSSSGGADGLWWIVAWAALRLLAFYLDLVSSPSLSMILLFSFWFWWVAVGHRNGGGAPSASTVSLFLFLSLLGEGGHRLEAPELLPPWPCTRVKERASAPYFCSCSFFFWSIPTQL